ncbi:uncharacterized protein LOC129928227 isoform X2 [Biomphalaria glabrata]|uniref:Uncharacterized protein LOC129928227 isoform X2 n=1 Tax=Biomphalaria glabrata TaxID=6526 RepID=A0A9W3BDJ2_BIOGL|nr:uncharacterized protein LOC129928227 isoform X2 [Biomphalaria glabrata]
MFSFEVLGTLIQLKMRPNSELADISSKLENLEEINDFFQNIVMELSLVKNKCELWIQEKETLTFTEVKEYITETTKDILQRCISVTSSQLKMVADSATILENNIPLQPVSFKVSNSISTEYQTLTEKFKEINSSFTEQSKQFKKVQQKLKHQKLINKMLDERINKCVDDNAECTKLQENLNEKYVELKEEVTSEFYAASRFMAYLQTKCESLSQEFKESKAMCKEEDLTVYHDCAAEKIPQRHQNMLEKLDYIDQHEQQIMGKGKVDPQEYLKKCMKNPGHIHFIPVTTLTLYHLPEGHRDTDLYELMKAAADLTVKISVATTSPKRPEFWPCTNVPYPFHKSKEKPHLRTGSGMINKVMTGLEAICPCDNCKHSNKPNTDWWTIRVGTAANVVYNDHEAKYATLRLFYDTEESQDVSVTCARNIQLYKNVDADYCWFNCVTCDTELANKLEKMIQRYEALLKEITAKYRQTRDIHKLMFLVSHPHGCCKRISIGQWDEKSIVRKKNKTFTYSTYTCPGSSGAWVYCLGYDWSIHGGTMKCGLNYSRM